VPEIITGHGRGIGDAAVVCVVKEEAEARIGGTILADSADQRVRVPLVNDYDIGALQSGGEIERGLVIETALQMGVRPGKLLHSFAIFGEQVFEAPTTTGLEDLHVMAAFDEVRCDAAEKVGVAVIPIGHERVGEYYEAQAVLRIVIRES
jgi:hypothetical protein